MQSINLVPLAFPLALQLCLNNFLDTTHLDSATYVIVSNTLIAFTCRIVQSNATTTPVPAVRHIGVGYPGVPDVSAKNSFGTRMFRHTDVSAHSDG